MLRDRDGLPVPDVAESLEFLANEGYSKVVIMPTHMIEGEEYNNKIVAPARAFEGRFESLKTGKVLLSDRKEIGRASCRERV